MGRQYCRHGVALRPSLTPVGARLWFARFCQIISTVTHSVCIPNMMSKHCYTFTPNAARHAQACATCVAAKQSAGTDPAAHASVSWQQLHGCTAGRRRCPTCPSCSRTDLLRCLLHLLRNLLGRRQSWEGRKAWQSSRGACWRHARCRERWHWCGPPAAAGGWGLRASAPTDKIARRPGHLRPRSIRRKGGLAVAVDRPAFERAELEKSRAVGVGVGVGVDGVGDVGGLGAQAPRVAPWRHAGPRHSEQARCMLPVRRAGRVPGKAWALLQNAARLASHVPSCLYQPARGRSGPPRCRICRQAPTGRPSSGWACTRRHHMPGGSSTPSRSTRHGCAPAVVISTHVKMRGRRGRSPASLAAVHPHVAAALLPAART